MITLVDCTGYLAAAVTTASLLPQLIKLLKTKSANDISIWMFAVYFFGNSLWFTYGYLLRSLPIMLSNIIALVVIGLTIILIKKYTCKE